ncbi:MAG: zinc ribbon domain-containing protein [Bacilli bacterium]|nr:zinc ribbon domain-containing protein [Bacilli bacterium]MBR3049609.1 zinc ribbon domain-containing protein [Bacilli bacterium]
MVCKNCGNNLDEHMTECPLCGTKVEREVNNMNEEQNNVETLNNEQTNNTMNNDFNQPMSDINNNINNDMNNNVTDMNNNTDMNNDMGNMNTNNFNQPMNDMNNNFNQPMNDMNNNFNQPTNNMQPMNNMPQKKSSTGFIIIVAILVVIIATLGGILFMTLNKDKETTSTTENDNTTVEQTSTDETFTNGGLTFKKVDGYYYSDAGSDVTKIMDDAGTFYAEVGVGAYPYDKVKESKDAVKEELAKQVTVTGSDVKTFGSREYILFSVEKDGTGAILGYTKLDDTHTLVVAVGSTEGLDAAFTKLNKILDGIKLADGTEGESSFAVTTIPSKDKSKSFTKTLK